MTHLAIVMYTKNIDECREFWEATGLKFIKEGTTDAIYAEFPNGQALIIDTHYNKFGNGSWKYYDETENELL